MPTPEDIAQQQQILATYRRTLAHYLEQKAISGAAFVQPNVAHGMFEARQNIRRIEEGFFRSERDGRIYFDWRSRNEAKAAGREIDRLRNEVLMIVNNVYDTLGMRPFPYIRGR